MLGQGLDQRAGTFRKGDQPKDWRATGPKNRRATTPRTGQVPRYFFNLDFGGRVPEASSTSRTMASRRSVPRVARRPVEGRGTAAGNAVHSSLFCSFPSLCSCHQVLRTCLASSRWTLGLQLTATVRAASTLMLAKGLSATRRFGFEVPGAFPSRVSHRLDVVRDGQFRRIYGYCSFWR